MQLGGRDPEFIKVLEQDPRFHRYAIAARRIPELRQVRASLLGRAIHSSFEAWQTQVANILAKA